MKVTNRTILRVLWRHAWKYKLSVIVVVGATIIAVATDAITPFYFKKLIDAVAASNPETAAFSSISIFLFIIFGFSIVRWIGWRIVGYVTSYYQPRVMSDLEQTSFNYLLDHSYQFFSDNFAGSLVRKVGRMSRAFERLSDEFQFRFLPVTVILIGTTVGLALRYPWIALVFLIWAIAFIYLNYLASLWKLKIDIKKVEADSKATGALSDALTNSVTIKLFAGEKFERSAFRKVMEYWRSLQHKSWMRGEHIFTVQHGIMVVVDFGLMYWGLTLWQKQQMTVGDLILIQTYLGVVISRLWDIGRTFRTVYESLADAGEMVEILEAPHDVIDRPRAAKLVVSEGKIEFKNVDFNFHATRKVLDHFDLSIAPSEKIALVGASGAGKTTVTKLLFRLYDVTAGDILIDDQNIAQVTQQSLRQSIAMVPQEPILFHRTLMENIRYGKPGASDEEVIAAAEKARCHEFIMGLPEGYNTFVGERGIKLSGGERQRVAIARAILKDAPILVLDEATSSLDSESEHLIQAALSELMKGKTTIVIAHRLSTIMLMDRIVVLENGSVATSGTHEALLKKKGTYRMLWEIQAGGFIAPDGE